jgi:hypothetical protein
MILEFDTASLVVAVQHQHHFKTWEIKEVGLDGEVINVLFQTSPIYPGVTGNHRHLKFYHY